MSPDEFHRKLLATVQRWNMLPPGSRIGVAVSGGADSIALLCALHNLAPHAQWQLTVLHVNHKLRGVESDDDARFVQDLAGRLGLFLQIADLPLLPCTGNLEQEARKARYSWFQACAQGLDACAENLESCTKLHKVALGHTRSDQAETVLFRFLRGSGGAGLSGIRPVLDNGFVRPLFEISRHDVRSYLHNIGQAWRDDSSNQDLAFDRNRIRLNLLPNLAQQWNPQIESTLAATGDWARAEEEYWAQVVAALAVVHVQNAPDGAQLCTTGSLRNLPLAAARRLIRHVIQRVRGDLQSIDFAHVEQILALAAQPDGSGRLQVPGVDVIRSFDWIRFAAPGTYAGNRFSSVPVQWPGEFALPESNSRLLLQLENADSTYNDILNCFDALRMPGLLLLRTWQPGDQYRQLGSAFPVKLKSLFQDARIPIWERRTWPVLVAGSPDVANKADRENIVWSRRFGVADDFAPDSSTRQVIRIVEKIWDYPNNQSQNGNQEPDLLRL